MPIVGYFIIIGLALLFPKGFKYMVGTWLGFCLGGFVWCVAALWTGGLFSLPIFGGFALGGIMLGCWLAAKG